MNEYLITNALTGDRAWWPGETLEAALFAAETARRAALKLPTWYLTARHARCWTDHDGGTRLAGIGDSYIRGLSSAVCRRVVTP